MVAVDAGAPIRCRAANERTREPRISSTSCCSFAQENSTRRRRLQQRRPESGDRCSQSPVFCDPIASNSMKLRKGGICRLCLRIKGKSLGFTSASLAVKFVHVGFRTH